MTNKSVSLPKRMLSALLTLSMMFTLITPISLNTYASSEEWTHIKVIPPLSDYADIKGNNVVLSTPVLEYIADGKKLDGWYVGIQVFPGESYTDRQLDDAAIIDCKGDEYPFKDIKYYNSSDGCFEDHYEITEELLNEKLAEDAASIEYSYTFKWDEDTEEEVKVKVELAGLTLKKDGKSIYPSSAALGEIKNQSEGYESSDVGDMITKMITNISNVTLQYMTATENEEIPGDGWYMYYTIEIPNGADSSKATYKKKLLSGWGEALPFGEGETQKMYIPITPAELLDALENDKSLTHAIEYDMNGDGVYEQLVIVKTDPKKIKLLKGEGESTECAYPLLGAVISLNGGKLEGTDYHKKVTVESVELTYSESEPWRAGIMLTVPSGYTEAQKNKGKIKTVGEDGELNIKDETDNDGNIRLYIELDQAKIDENVDIVKNYVIDWDGDGGEDQKITFTVVISGVTLNKAEQSTFEFETKNPTDIPATETYTNKAAGGSGSGSITYEITNEQAGQIDPETGNMTFTAAGEGEEVATIDPVSGEVTFIKAGKITVKATKAEDEHYNEASCEYTLVGAFAKQDGFKFANSNENISVEFDDGEFTNTASGGRADGKITYTISDESIATIDENTGKVTFIKAGEVTVWAAVDGDDKHESAKISYKLEILHSEQAPLVIDKDVPTSITWSGEAQSNFITVSGGSGTGEITYTIKSGDEYATFDENGNIKTNKAGGSFTVEVIKEGDDGYKASSPVTITITVLHAEQAELVFDEPYPDDVTYNDNGNVFDNAASGGSAGGDIIYELAQGNDIAEIDKDTGRLTIKAAGTIKVKATLKGDEHYKDTYASYTLTVKKDRPEFEAEDVSLYYGVKEHKIEINTLKGSNGGYSYKIIGENTIGATIEDTGKLTFSSMHGKVGEIKVRIEKAPDSCYEGGYTELNVTLSYHVCTRTDEIGIDGEKKNESGWYTGKVTITPPDGYSISGSNSLDTSWSDKLEISADGVHSTYVYLNYNGEFTDAISLGDIKLDTQAPTNVKVEYDNDYKEKLLAALSFGIYKPKTVYVTLSAEDTTSGIEKLVYNIGNGDITVAEEDIIRSGSAASCTISLNAEYRGKVSLTVYDTAGHISQATSEHILVIDSVSPTLNVKYESENRQERDGILYSSKDVTLLFEIKEDNFDLRSADPVFEINGVQAELEWSFDAVRELWCAEYTVSGDGTYEISLNYSDESENKMTEYEKTITIDSQAPSITSSYTSSEPIKEGIFDSSRTLNIQIEEEHFDPEDMMLVVTVLDINGTLIDISDKNYASYIKDLDNWSYDGEKYSISLPAFDTDGIYSVGVAYTDPSGNEATGAISDTFTIDTTKPDVRLEYKTPIIEKIIESLSFGFFKSEVTVRAEIADSVSGVEYIKLTYTREIGVSEVNRESFTTEPLIPARVPNSNVFVCEYKIPAQARGSISYVASDNAGNVKTGTDAEILVVDSISPSINVTYTPYKIYDPATKEYKSTFTDGDGSTLYYNDKAEAIFKIKEDNFDLSLADPALRPVIKDNGSSVAVTWTESEGEWRAVCEIDGEGEHILTLDYTDPSENEPVHYVSNKLVIDRTSPSIKIERGTPVSSKDGCDIYGTYQNVKLVITENDLDINDVVLAVSATDIDGDPVDISAKHYEEQAHKESSWVHEGNKHTLELRFDIDAIYDVSIKCDDICDNEATEKKTLFAIDTTKPAGAEISYDTPIIDKVISSLTFGFYKQRVSVTLSASDGVSGVERFEYAFIDQATGKEIKHFSLSSANITYSGKTARAVFTLDADLRGHVKAWAFDRAGNDSLKDDSGNILVVDNISPSIDISYERAEADTYVRFITSDGRDTNSLGGAKYAYFGGAVKAKINVRDENFFEGVTSSEGVIHELSIKLTRTDEGGTHIYEYLPSGSDRLISDATPVYFDWTGANGLYSLEIDYVNDGDYVLEAEYVDISTNESEISSQDKGEVKKKYTSKPVTVDTTAPVSSVTFSEPAGRGDNAVYHASAITTRVTFEERVFYKEDVVIAVERDGGSVTPNIAWTDDGITHTASFTLDTDGVYTVSVRYTDRAGNAMLPYTSESHVLDTKAPELKLSGIAQSSAMNKEKISFTISADDNNIDPASLKAALNAIVRDKDGKYSAKQIPVNDIKQSNDKMTVSAYVDDLSEDGVYTLTCTVSDMAKNTSKAMLLEDGKKYESVAFSVNRNGSVFFADDNTVKLTEKYYVSNVENDVVIFEVNTDAIEKYSVSVNDTVLTEGEGFTTQLTQNEGQWAMRTYTVSKSLFEGEGQYTVVVSSQDKTESTAYSDVKALNVSFAVDRTPPVITVSGLQNGGRYRASNQTVTLMPTDDGGKLYSLAVTVLSSDGSPIKNENGEDISVRFNMSGEELSSYLSENNGCVIFSLPEGLEMQVLVSCRDMTENGNEYSVTYSSVTVSGNELIIFYANKPLFYGVITAAVLIVGSAVAFPVIKKRKKEKTVG